MVTIIELRQFNIFKRLTDSELDLIRDIVRKEEREAGERVIEENAEAKKLYLVLEGRASIKKSGDFGRREAEIASVISSRFRKVIGQFVSYI